MATKGKASHKSISKVENIRCRVETCQEEIKTQNYERHLERYHPNENKKDKRPYGQEKNFYWKLTDKVENKDSEALVDEDNNKFAEVTEKVYKNVESAGEGKEHMPVPKKARLDEEEINGSSVNLDEIEKSVDDILDKLHLKFPDDLQVCVKDRIKSKLSFIKGNIRIFETVTELSKVIKEVKLMTLSEENNHEASSSLEDIKRILMECRSVSDIEAKVPEFLYEEEREKVVCQICKTEFGYDVSLETGRKQSESLVNLKFSLKRHLVEYVQHRNAVGMEESKCKIERKVGLRNETCGMNLGKTCFYLLSNGRPNSDFTELLSMQHRNGCDIGNINHSSEFINNMAGSFSEVITGRIKNHLSNRLPQTGCLPPCKVIEDGATYRHDTRHLIGLTTVFPGDSPLIQSVFCGAPKGVKSDGLSTAKNMADTVAPYMSSQQYVGTSADGANFLAHVGEHLDKELGREGEGHHDWDGAHAAATIDTGLRNPKKPWAKQFSWLNDMTITISKSNRFFNWGQEWDRFSRVSSCAFFLVCICIFGLFKLW